MGERARAVLLGHETGEQRLTGGRESRLRARVETGGHEEGEEIAYGQERGDRGAGREGEQHRRSARAPAVRDPAERHPDDRADRPGDGEAEADPGGREADDVSEVERRGDVVGAVAERVAQLGQGEGALRVGGRQQVRHAMDGTRTAAHPCGAIHGLALGPFDGRTAWPETVGESTVVDSNTCPNCRPTCHGSARWRHGSCCPWTGCAARSRRRSGRKPRSSAANGTGHAAPDWLIEMGLGGRAPVYVHVGGCHMAGKRSRGVTDDQARRALWEQVPPCPHCHPDGVLGVLD